MNSKKYQEQVIYETKTSDLKSSIESESDIGPEIVHEYKIINKGPSEFLRSELLLAWQKTIKNSLKSAPFLYLMETPYTEGPISCSSQFIDINPFNFSVIFLTIWFSLTDLSTQISDKHILYAILKKLTDDKLRNPEKYYKIAKEVPVERAKRYLGYNDKLNIFDFIPSSIYLGDRKSSNLDDFDENVECSSGMITIHF